MQEQYDPKLIEAAAQAYWARTRAYEANSRNQIVNLVNAIQRYNADFRAFPGPFHNDEIGTVADELAVIRSMTSRLNTL